MTEQEYKDRRWPIFPLLILSFILGTWWTYNSFRQYDSFDFATGIVIDKGVRKEIRKVNNEQYTFYFKLNSTNQVFGIFLGSGENALKRGEYYDELIKLNQQISIYFDNNLIAKSENITRLIYRLEYNGKVILESDQKGRRKAGLIAYSIMLIFLLLLYWLKRKYKRELEKK